MLLVSFSTTTKLNNDTNTPVNKLTFFAPCLPGYCYVVLLVLADIFEESVRPVCQTNMSDIYFATAVQQHYRDKTTQTVSPLIHFSVVPEHYSDSFHGNSDAEVILMFTVSAEI